jgi:hypothetical protein
MQNSDQVSPGAFWAQIVGTVLYQRQDTDIPLPF